MGRAATCSVLFVEPRVVRTAKTRLWLNDFAPRWGGAASRCRAVVQEPQRQGDEDRRVRSECTLSYSSSALRDSFALSGY